MQNFSGLFNSKKDITKHIGNLSDFLNLLTLRQKAAAFGEDLSTFVILGNILLNDDGNTYLLQPEVDLEIIDVIVTLEEYIEIVGTTFNYMLLIDIPTPADVCPICGKGWDMGNFEDYEVFYLKFPGLAVCMHSLCSEKMKHFDTIML